MTFGGVVRNRAEVPDRAAARELAVQLDVDVRLANLDHVRVDQVGDADGVVDGRRAVLPGRLNELVALDPRPDDRGGRRSGRRAERGEPVAVVLGDERLVRGVERHDRQVADPAAQDDPGGLGVGPDVELRRRR